MNLLVESIYQVSRATRRSSDRKLILVLNVAVPFADLPRNVKLLQASLLAAMSPNSPPGPQNVPEIMQQSRGFISQLSQIAQLAYTASASRNTESGHPGTTSRTLSSEQHPALDTPIRVIGLVHALLSQLLPPILARLGDAESQEIIVCVAKEIIKPAIDFIVAICALPSGQTSEEMEHRPMIDSVTSLLDCLLLVRMSRNTVQSAPDSGESTGILFPFAEVVAVWSTELICTRMKHAIDQRSNVVTDRIATRRQSTINKSLNALFTTLLGIIGRCVGDPPYSNSSDDVAQDQNMERYQKPCIRLVDTRICDLLTGLIAALDSEGNTSPEAGTGTLFAAGVDTVPRSQDATDNLTGNSQSSLSLWEEIGLDRGMLVAMGCVAEQMMINEGAEDHDELLDARWLKDFCDEKQHWGI